MLLIFFVFCVVLLSVFTFRVPCYNFRYDVRIKTMFGSSLSPAVCKMAHVLCTLFAYNGVQNIVCCILFIFFFVLCTLCCQFLWIVAF
jgi:hypothetical protein